MEKRFKKTGIFAVIVALVVFILLGAANGILGELGVTVFQWLQQLSANLITMSSLPWIIIVLILLVALVSVIVIWQRAKYTLDTTNRIVDLDNWLQRLVPNLVSARFAAALQIYKELQIFRQSQQQYGGQGQPLTVPT